VAYFVTQQPAVCCCRRIPAPAGSPSQPLRLLLFDAFHDEYRGVVCLVAVVDGALRAGDKLAAASSGQEYEALEVRQCSFVAARVVGTGSVVLAARWTLQRSCFACDTRIFCFLRARGVVCLVAVVDSALRAGDKLAAASSGQEYEALEVRWCIACFIYMGIAELSSTGAWCAWWLWLTAR
jgi:translation elongation factor EF-4